LVVAALAARRAGGAICFASGFREAVNELSDGADLQAQLLEAAGEMPILGPNCYGLINALDGAVLWPDQHGAVRVERGVAIVTQSSNIAINLTMQKRGLPLAYIVPPLIAGGCSALLLMTAHGIAGTPEIWTTIAVPLVSVVTAATVPASAAFTVVPALAAISMPSFLPGA
jgi:hypothetical protein